MSQIKEKVIVRKRTFGLNDTGGIIVIKKQIKEETVIENKCDLEQNIEDDMSQQLARWWNGIFQKTSCKEKIGVQQISQNQETFYLEQLVVKHRKSNSENGNSSFKISSEVNNKQNQDKGLCC